MASLEAIVNKRVRAAARLRAALPGLSFRVTKGGAEYQHADDLEVIADYIESQRRKPAAAEHRGRATADTAAE